MDLTDENGDVDLEKCVQMLAEEQNADIWLYSGPINDFGFGEIIKNFPGRKKGKNALLILVTNGGLANAGYQIASLFQSHYDKFRFLFQATVKALELLSPAALINCIWIFSPS